MLIVDGESNEEGWFLWAEFFLVGVVGEVEVVGDEVVGVLLLMSSLVL